jgi:hypothetical protein
MAKKELPDRSFFKTLKVGRVHQLSYDTRARMRDSTWLSGSKASIIVAVAFVDGLPNTSRCGVQP